MCERSWNLRDIAIDVGISFGTVQSILTDILGMSKVSAWLSKAFSGSTLVPPLPKKYKRVSSAGKVMASVFGDNQGVIMIDYIEKGCTINGAYYAEELRWLHQEIVGKRRGKFTLGVLLLQDNAPACMSQVALAAQTECSLGVLPHLPYSPDFGPSDLYLFP